MEPARRTHQRIVPLGNLHGRRVDAVVTLVRTGGSFSDISVAYRWRDGRRWVSTEARPVNESYDDELHLFAHDFTHSGHKQLLVSCTLGRVCSYVFDLDGDHLKTQYSREDGRVVVRPVRGRRGGFDLEERYTPRQWEDHSDLGACHYDGEVRRTLHWDGKAFVSYHPGKSRIVNPYALPPDLRRRWERFR